MKKKEETMKKMFHEMNLIKKEHENMEVIFKSTLVKMLKVFTLTEKVIKISQSRQNNKKDINFK